jgi:hypothetical protein
VITVAVIATGSDRARPHRPEAMDDTKESAPGPLDRHSVKAVGVARP